MSYPPEPPSYPQQAPPPYGQRLPAYGPPPPQYRHEVRQPGTDGSKRFLNLSLGALVAIIAGILLVCCVGPIILCFLTPALSGVTDGLKEDPTVTITSCKITDGDVLPKAEISFTVKNNGSISDNYLIKFAVKDASGSRVGDGSDWVFDLGGGQSANGDTVVYLDTKGGKTCSVAEVS